MTTGDGGMIVTNKKSLYLDVNEKRWLGINKKHNNKSYIQKIIMPFIGSISSQN